MVMVLAGCAGGGAEEDEKDVPLKERTTIKQFSIVPLLLDKVKPCDLMRPKAVEELELAEPENEWNDSPHEVSNGCVWAGVPGETMGLEIHQAKDSDAVQSVLLGGNADLIKGYPAGMLPISASSCDVEVAVSDTAYFRMKALSSNRAGACALGVRAAQEVLSNLHPY